MQGMPPWLRVTVSLLLTSYFHGLGLLHHHQLGRLMLPLATGIAREAR